MEPYDDPLEVLDTLLFPFPDPEENAHGIPGPECREIAPKLRRLQFLEDVAHHPNPFPESVPCAKQD